MRPASKSSFLDRVLGRIGRLDAEGLQTVIQRLARERSFLETLFNTIEDGVLVVDERGRVIYFNQSVVRLLGLSAQGAEGQHVSQVLPELDWEALAAQESAPAFPQLVCGAVGWRGDGQFRARANHPRFDGGAAKDFRCHRKRTAPSPDLARRQRGARDWQPAQCLAHPSATDGARVEETAAGGGREHRR